MPRRTATRALENSIRRLGFPRVVGVDEVGRGCLAGPVVAAAVVLDPKRRITGLRDSKLLTPAARERLFLEITSRAVAWSLGSSDPAEIDRLNIHQASLAAMRQAVTLLAPLPDYVLVDGFVIPDLHLPQRRVIGGDRRCAAIAAASIVAKVSRDRQMRAWHVRDPRYGFGSHKGYATAQHLEALARFGYSALHRKSFRPQSLFDRIDGPASSHRGQPEGG